MARFTVWLLSCVFLASCVMAELIYVPGGKLVDTDCIVELPMGATAGEGVIVLADGTLLVLTTRSIANGWNEYAYFYPGYNFDILNGDWVVPNTPSVGYTQQLLYFFTGLEPVSQDVILQPVVWYGVSPKGGGDGWYAACWEVHSDNSVIVSNVVRVYPGAQIHTTMTRYPGAYWNCNMYSNGALVSSGNFADREYPVAFVSVEVYYVPDCTSLANQYSINFYNLQIHREGGDWVSNPNWEERIVQSDCGQSVYCTGDGSQCLLGYFPTTAILSPLIFDAGVYKSINTDLPWSDAGNLQNHWINYGIYEGRQATNGFNVNEYKSIYSDLAPLSNYDAALHYARNGFSEGRVGSLAYDWLWYLQYNGDLINAFGYSRFLANSHWTGNGIYEGRQASPSFWTPRYLSLYADLQAAFGNNYYVACLHWINNGYHEGRRGV